MNKTSDTPKIIKAAAITGFIFAALGLLGAGIEAFFLLTVLPFLCCLGLLIKKWWVCGAVYCVVYLLARLNMFTGQATALAIAINIGVLVLFVKATIAAYKLRCETSKSPE